jgi:hypothetical protein
VNVRTQSAPVVVLGSLQPVTAVACGKGMGLAASPALGLLVTSNLTDDTISAFELRPPEYRRLGTWGGRGFGPLQFMFSGDSISGGLCFTVPADAASAPPLLLVASHGSDCVAVLDVRGVAAGGAPVPAGTFGAGNAAAPRCVTAVAALVAVSGWTKGSAGDHTVTLYTPLTWARVRVLCAGRGFGPRDGQLHVPYGLCFTPDGARLLVTDVLNGRVCAFAVADGAFLGTVANRAAHGLASPFAVVVVAGGVLVADDGRQRLVHLPADGSPASELGGVRGAELGEFTQPSALYLSPDGAQLIVREQGGRRFQVFNRRE